MANINSDDLKPKDENKPNSRKPNLPKFNFYWIYGIIAIVMMGL